PEAPRVAGGGPEFLERRRTLVPRAGVAAGMQLDRRDPELAGAVEGGAVGVHEEREPDPLGGQPADRVGEPRVAPAEVEPALGGDLLAPLGDEGGLEGTQPRSQRDDRLAGGELEVEDRRD